MIFNLVSAIALAGAAAAPPPVYTNEDLARVHPFAAETGVASEPAQVPNAALPEPGSGAARGARAARGEDYWRREAQRAAARTLPLERQADEVRARIADRERQKGVRPVSDPQLSSLRERLRKLEGRARAIQTDLEDRARRAGALPGWLR